MTMLLPTINEQFKGDIWRLEIDSITDILCLEVRTADRQVSFTSIALADGKVNFKDYTTPERWLTGIEAIYDGVLLLHNFESENTPVHKGLVAIDVNANLLWSNYTYAFDHLSANGPVIFSTQIQPKKLLLADIKTGQFVRTFEQAIDTEPENYIQFPTPSEASGLSSQIFVEAHGNIMYSLHYNNFRIVSLHTLKAGQLKHFLYITDGDNPVYEDLLNADIQKMQPESFILYKNWLIYIKNKSELKVINLHFSD